MKNLMKSLKYFVIVLICIITVTFSGCFFSEPTSIVKIEKTATSGLVDTYTITYSNGSSSTFQITNGKNGYNGEDGKDGLMITINDIYEEWKENTNETDKSYDNFIRLYLDDIIKVDNQDEVKATNNALRSVVSIFSTFTVYGVIDYNYDFGMFPSYKYGNYDVSSAGSGVIYKIDIEKDIAYIITNYHVVYYKEAVGIENNLDGISTRLKIYLYGQENNQSTIDAKFLGGSLTYDIAVLQVKASDILSQNENAKSVTVANSNDIVVGETAIAVGNPEAEGISATSGVISVDSEYIQMTASDEVTTVKFRVMRVDTAINGGNSGGGLFDSEGNLIGIVNAKIIDETIENIGYAIPSKVAIGVAENIIANCNGDTVKSPKIAKLGIELRSENSKTIYDSESGTLKIEEDVIIDKLVENGKGITSGLKVEDKIISCEIGGVTYNITRTFHVIDLMLQCRNNTTIKLNVKRFNEETKQYDSLIITINDLTSCLEIVK